MKTKIIWQRCPALIFCLVQLMIMASTSQLAAQNMQGNPETQKRIVTGRVADSLGVPLVNVTIHVKRQDLSTESDERGGFSIEVESEDDILEFFYMGYKRLTLPISPGFMEVVMVAEAYALDEVVVVGYSTQKMVNLTGAVVQIDGDVMENRPATNIGQALQGVVPNLNITTTGDPGGPGTPAVYNIRGTSSINGGSPLYVVDGIPADNLNNLNPADIASISVLKDAAAGAIYGSRASYGVILVTTKSGAVSDKLSVNVSTLTSWNTYTALPKMANSVEFAETFNQAAINSGVSLPFSDEFLNRLRTYMQNPGSIPVTTPMPNDPNIYGFTDANDNVNWLETYLKPWSTTQKYDLNVSGGNENTTYYFAAGIFDHGGQLRYTDEKYTRYNLTSNIHAEPTRWLRADLKIRYARENTDIPYHYSNLQGNWLHLAGSRRPYWPLIDPNGIFSRISQITFFTEGGRTLRKNNDLWVTGMVEAEPVSGWKINANYSVNVLNNTYSDHNAFVNATAIDGSKYNISNTQNSLTRGTDRNDYTSFNIYSSYEKQLSKHSFLILAGQQMEVKTMNTFTAQRMDLITDQLPSLQTATGAQYATDAITEWSTMGTFGRFTYNYDEKYLLEVNARYDGTSRFPKGKRFGFFPSVAVAYNIAKEDFWPLKGNVDYFKVRASYGSLGNQTLGNLANSEYLYIPVYSVYPNTSYVFDGDLTTYLGVPGIVSPNLTWETVRSLNLGLDAALLGNRLNVTLDWYTRNTLDMLGPAYALPAALGATVPLMNNADLKTTGFELALNWQDRLANELTYHASLVLSDYTATVERYNNPTGILTTYYEGQTIGEIWGYETVGIIQDTEQAASIPDQSMFYGRWLPGDIEYRDLDGNGIIDMGNNTIDDHGDKKVIGNSTPRYSIGSTLGFEYKNFDFNMFWQGILKRDIAMNGSFFYGLPNSVWKNTLDYWTPENRDAYWSQPYATGEYNKNRQVQTRYLQNGAYLRLKNLQVGYTLPARLASKVSLDRIRLFFSGENLLTFSNLIDDMDPETSAVGSWGSGKVYPLTKSFSIGLNVSL